MYYVEDAAVGRNMLRKLEAFEEAADGQAGYTGNSRWMVPYADLLTLLLGLFLILFSLSSQNNKALNAETKQMKTVLTQKEQKIQARDAELKQLKENMSALAVAVNVPNRGATETAHNIERSLVEKLGIKQGLTVHQDERGVVISLSDRVLFAPGNAGLSPSATQTLHRLAEVLKSVNRPICVEGHTDNTPIATRVYPSNWELSTARATTIVRFLITRLQFPPRNLSAAGYGEYRPMANNSSIEGKQKNRRVDIVILNRPALISAPIQPQSGGVKPKPAVASLSAPINSLKHG